MKHRRVVQAAPADYVIDRNGALVPARFVKEQSQWRLMRYNLKLPDWRSDPSYFWADETRRKRLQK
jgi:hypothetical protein